MPDAEPSASPGDEDAAARQSFADLDRSERRRIIGRAALRTLLSIALLVAMYLVVAPADLAEGTVASGLVLALVLLALLVAWELYRTLNDPYPEVRAATSLLVLVTAVIIVFALVYSAISAADPASFTEALTKEGAVYYTVTTLSTTGFGDIAAVSPTARWAVTVQMLFDLVLLVGLARVFMLAAKAGRARKKKA